MERTVDRIRLVMNVWVLFTLISVLSVGSDFEYSSAFRLYLSEINGTLSAIRENPEKYEICKFPRSQLILEGITLSGLRDVTKCLNAIYKAKGKGREGKGREGRKRSPFRNGKSEIEF